MHAEINVRFVVSIAQDKTLPLATLAESLAEMQLEATILEEILRSLDERLVETGKARARKRRPPFPARWNLHTNRCDNRRRTRISVLPNRCESRS